LGDDQLGRRDLAQKTISTRPGEQRVSTSCCSQFRRAMKPMRPTELGRRANKPVPSLRKTHERKVPRRRGATLVLAPTRNAAWPVLGGCRH
jgi:hypothetical protein